MGILAEGLSARLSRPWELAKARVPVPDEFESVEDADAWQMYLCTKDLSDLLSIYNESLAQMMRSKSEPWAIYGSYIHAKWLAASLAGEVIGQRLYHPTGENDVLPLSHAGTVALVMNTLTSLGSSQALAWRQRIAVIASIMTPDFVEAMKKMDDEFFSRDGGSEYDLTFSPRPS